MKSSKPLESGSWIRRQRFFAWLWVIGRSSESGRKGRSRRRSAEVEHRPLSVTAGTVEQPSSQQPVSSKGLRWQVSTSGMAPKGLGWPLDGAGNDEVSSSGLGWPTVVDLSVPEMVPESVLAPPTGLVPEVPAELDPSEVLEPATAPVPGQPPEGVLESALPQDPEPVEESVGSPEGVLPEPVSPEDPGSVAESVVGSKPLAAPESVSEVVTEAAHGPVAEPRLRLDA